MASITSSKLSLSLSGFHDASVAAGIDTIHLSTFIPAIPPVNPRPIVLMDVIMHRSAAAATSSCSSGDASGSECLPVKCTVTGFEGAESSHSSRRVGAITAGTSGLTQPVQCPVQPWVGSTIIPLGMPFTLQPVAVMRSLRGQIGPLLFRTVRAVAAVLSILCLSTGDLVRECIDNMPLVP